MLESTNGAFGLEKFFHVVVGGIFRCDLKSKIALAPRFPFLPMVWLSQFSSIAFQWIDDAVTTAGSAGVSRLRGDQRSAVPAKTTSFQAISSGPSQNDNIDVVEYQSMHLNIQANPVPQPSDVISCWRLGEQITGGRWYNLFRVAPKTVRSDSRHGFVIKIVNPHLDPNDVPKAIDRLGREAVATEQIVHPNVIRLLDAELDHAPFFLIQPWVEGKTLDRLFSRAPHLPLTRILWVLRQIAEGVRAGHEKGRVYLGLDPSHVLLGKTGRVTLVGWSQSHGFEESAWLPSDNIQSARYTAPECFEPDYRANPASDVYSLGTLIYQSLNQRVPFDGLTVDAIKDAHQSEIAEDLIFAQPQTPRRLSNLVKQMLAKNPLARPTLHEVLDQLITIEIEHLSDNRLIKL